MQTAPQLCWPGRDCTVLWNTEGRFQIHLSSSRLWLAAPFHSHCWNATLILDAEHLSKKFRPVVPFFLLLFSKLPTSGRAAACGFAKERIAVFFTVESQRIFILRFLAIKRSDWTSRLFHSYNVFATRPHLHPITSWIHTCFKYLSIISKFDPQTSWEMGEYCHLSFSKRGRSAFFFKKSYVMKSFVLND